MRELSVLGYETCRIRRDRGTEFSGDFKSLVDSLRLKDEPGAIHSPWSNGKAERSWRSLNATMKAIATHAGLENASFLWTEMMQHAVWLNNRRHKKSLNMSPYMYLRHTADGKRVVPSADGLLCFGAKAELTHLPQHIKTKWKSGTKTLTGYYVGVSRVSEHCPRWFVPGLNGGSFVETKDFKIVESLEEASRISLPDDLKPFIGHRHPKTTSAGEERLNLIDTCTTSTLFEDEGHEEEDDLDGEEGEKEVENNDTDGAEAIETPHPSPKPGDPIAIETDAGS